MNTISIKNSPGNKKVIINSLWTAEFWLTLLINRSQISPGHLPEKIFPPHSGELCFYFCRDEEFANGDEENEEEEDEDEKIEVDLRLRSEPATGNKHRLITAPAPPLRKRNVVQTEVKLS